MAAATSASTGTCSASLWPPTKLYFGKPVNLTAGGGRPAASRGAKSNGAEDMRSDPVAAQHARLRTASLSRSRRVRKGAAAGAGLAIGPPPARLTNHLRVADTLAPETGQNRMKMAETIALQNARALARLNKALPEVFPAAGAHPCARPPLHPADAAAGGRLLLARPSGARRPARPRAGGEDRRARRLDLAARLRPRQGSAGHVPRSRRALSREEAPPRPGLLLRVRPAGVCVRLASRPVGARAEPQGAVAHRLRDGVAPVERAERFRKSPAPRPAAPLRADRRPAVAHRRGRSPRPAVPGVARASRHAVAEAARLLGPAQPADDQPRRPRGEMRRRGELAHESARPRSRTTLWTSEGRAPSALSRRGSGRRRSRPAAARPAATTRPHRSAGRRRSAS